MPRSQTPNACKRRRLAGDELEAEIVSESLRIERGGTEDARERYELGREPDGVVADGDEQGFFPHPIAREQDPPSTGVIEGKGEHPAQVFDAGVAVLEVEGEDHLAVAAGAKAVTTGRERIAQCVVVVDLAVGNEHQPLIVVVQGLRTARHVDDAETAVDEPDVLVEESAGAVGATVGESLLQCVGPVAFDVAGPKGRDETRDAAHLATLAEVVSRRSRHLAVADAVPRRQDAHAMKPIRLSSCFRPARR